MLQQGGSAERDSAALRLLREYVNYTRKLTIPCDHLPAIQSTAHDWLLRDSKETGVKALDLGFMQAQQVDDLYTTTKTSRVAQALLQELALLCQDTTVGAQARFSLVLRTAGTGAMHLQLFLIARVLAGSGE